MNILYLTHTKDGGGARIALVNIAKELIQKGHTINVIVPSEESRIAKEMLEIGANIYIAPISLTLYPHCKNPFRWIKRLIWKLFEWHKTKKIINKIVLEKHIDLVHTNVGPMDLALNVCKRNKIPHVWHHREYFDKYENVLFFPTKNRFLQQIHDKNNYNITITKQLFNYYRLSETGNKSKVIYDGVFDNKQIPKTVAKEKRKYFLTVGRVEKNKATYELIKSFLAFYINHPEYELKIIGRYTQTDTYYLSCLSLLDENTNKAVHFVGERNDVYQQMAEATAVIVPSYFEGFGFTTVEAMLNHTLVIGRNTTGTKEQFDNGVQETGSEIALRFNNLMELTNAMEATVSFDHSEMIERSFQHVCNFYSAERSANEVELFYKEITNSFET